MRLVDTYRLFTDNITNTESLLLLVKDSTDLNKAGIKKLRALGPRKSTAVEGFISNYYGRRRIKAQTPTNPASYERSLKLIRGLETKVMTTALHQAVTQLCIAYEDFSRKVFLKFYEDDKRRLHSDAKSLSDGEIIELLESNWNIHRALAEKAVERWTYGSVDKWHQKISEKLDIEIGTDARMKELFLLRNALVHNDGKNTKELNLLNTEKFPILKRYRLSIDIFTEYKNVVHQTATYLQARFDEKYPVKGTDWYLDFVDSLEDSSSKSSEIQ